MRKNVCRWCGKEFYYNAKRRKYYCCNECRENGAYAAIKRSQQGKQIKREKEKHQRPADVISANQEAFDISEVAFKMRMSYGEYVAWCREKGVSP